MDDGRWLAMGAVAAVAGAGFLRRGRGSSDQHVYSWREVFDYFVDIAHADESYRHLFEIYPEWTLVWIDPSEVESYTESGAIQRGFRDDDDERAAHEYARRGLEGAPPAIFVPYDRPPYRWLHRDGQTRARAAYLLGERVLAFVPKREEK